MWHDMIMFKVAIKIHKKLKKRKTVVSSGTYIKRLYSS